MFLVVETVLVLAAGCGESPGGGDGDASATGGHAGAAGATDGRGKEGTAGTTGSGGAAGAGGTIGEGGVRDSSMGGSGGSAGAGTAGNGGNAGVSGAAGRSGAGGAAGTAGTNTAGQGGAAGGAGAGGRSGSAGSAGVGGASGASGASGSGGTDGGATVLAATPPMGWNSWNTFQCNMDESLIKGVADTMVSSGMKAVGYEYVNLDDCWMNGRDASGNLRWNTTKFPSGIPALADYVHGKGLKFGIYQSANTKTCVGLYGGVDGNVAVGSLNYEAADAKTFASWGVDFLKYDLCAGDRNSFVKMRDGLRATGRPIVYSINPGNGSNDLCPPSKCSLNLVSIAHMWRIGFDINASWSSVTGLIDQDAPLDSYAGPGHWNDPDMLEVGKGLSATEDRSHFAMWAILAAPLIAGNDIRSMSAATRDILTNAEVIAVDQDSLGAQGRLVATPATNLQVWSKKLSGTNVRAVALFNRTDTTAAIAAQWSAIGLPAGKASVRDLSGHTDLGTFTDSYTANAIPSHGVVLLKIASAP